MMTAAILAPHRFPASRRTPAPVSLASQVAAAARQPGVTELDARGPTPPQTVPAIIAAMQANPPSRPQFVRTASAPTVLRRALEVRGYDAYPTQLPDGSWQTLVIAAAGTGSPVR